MLARPARSTRGFANGVDLDDRPNLDAARAGPGKLRRDAHGLVHAVGLDEVEACDHLLCLGERSVERRLTALSNSDGLRGRRRAEHLRVVQFAAASQVVGVCETRAHARVEFRFRQLVQQFRC